MINIGVIGYGHWGKNHIRVFNQFSNSQVLFCADINKKNFDKIEEVFPNIKTTQNYNDLLENKEIDAIVISTSSSTHYEIAKESLLKNKDVLVEKPLTLTVQESEELISLAEEKQKILMVGHTFLYNSAILKMKEYFLNKELGEIYYLHSIRTHLGLIREDVNCVYDLATHDISIFSYLLESQPNAVSAVGGCYLKENREDIAFITLFYSQNKIGNIHVSWINANKERQLTVVGSKKRIVFNDLDNLEKIRIFEKGICLEKTSCGDFGEFQLLLRDGDIISPKIEISEPLKKQNQHFLDCIQNRKKPLTDGKNGLDVIKVLVAIEKSLKQNGAYTKI
ncbi:MAG: Gfo/Idh/MocA family oxidoreductase [bacterium]